MSKSKGNRPLPKGQDEVDEEHSSSSSDYRLPSRQDPDKRRQIRHEYRHLAETIRENQHELAVADSEELQKKLEQCNKIFKKVQMTREAALDSQVVAQLSHLGRKRAQSLNTDLVVFQPSEFCEKLITFLRGGTMPVAGQAPPISQIGWTRLGEAVQPFFKRSPPIHFMYGAFTSEEKQKKVFNRRKRDPDEKLANVPIKTPNTNVDMKKKESTTEEVHTISKILHQTYERSQREPICLLEFVVNPHSYGQTVENLFYTSFLVRDGLAKITFDEDKLPNIEPVGEVEGVDPSVMPKNQVGFILSMQEWRAIVKGFHIDNPLIPTRARVHKDQDDENGNNIVTKSSSSRKGKASASHPAKGGSKAVQNGLHSPECNGVIDSAESDEEDLASTSTGRGQKTSRKKQKR